LPGQAIANILARAGTPLTAAAETTAAEVRSSKVVALDETSARVEGRNWWQWVLLSSTAVHHLIPTGQARGLKAHDSRGAAVLTDFLGQTKPDVWVADRYAAQAGHGNERQLCLAHLLRDAQYAPGLRRGRLDAGDTGFALGFQKLLRRAAAIGQRRPELKDTTLAQYRADLDRRLDRLLAVSPTVEAGRKLARAIRKCRGDLFVFITRRDVHQQRLRACFAAQRDLPESHRRVPLPMGRSYLCRRFIRHRHRAASWPFRSPGPR
jgi:transposase